VNGSLAEQLTANFYLWEQRGRGWQLWDYTVELEPPYEPFFFHYVSPQHTIDDARKPTFLSGLAEKFVKAFTRPQPQEPAAVEFLEAVPSLLAPSRFDDTSSIYEIVVFLPPEEMVTGEQTDQFLLTLSHCTSPVSFEVVGSQDAVVVQFGCREHDIATIKQEIMAFFPGAFLGVRERPLQRLLNTNKKLVVIDFGLSDEFMRPVRTFKSFDPDPLTGVMGALENLRVGEVGLLQVLFQAAYHPWTQSILRSVTDSEGNPFFVDAPEMVQMAREKTRRPLFAAVIRVVGGSSTTDRAWGIAKELAASLRVFAEPYSNELIPLTNEGYDEEDHKSDVLLRETHRSGMLLNSKELATLIHLPSASVQTKKLKRLSKKTKAAPSISIGHELVIGENLHYGKSTTISLSPEQRLRHIYIIGATGTGKTTLLENLIIQDIQNGKGIAVLDPHGDLIDQILGHIPEERFNDVILLDPSDSEYPVGLNILSAYSEVEKTLLTSDLVAAFRRLSTSWGDQMTSVLGNAIQAFMESEVGGSLVELRKFLLDRDYRGLFLETVKDEEVHYFWEKQFPFLHGKPEISILTRLDGFLRPKLIRNMISQKEGLDFSSILNEKKIFLAKLAQGLIGEENASLLGTMLVSKLHQAAMARQLIHPKERQNFYLYIDEFQNFITLSMAAVLSGARKYSLGLILAHQDLRQLWNQDTEVANSVISNPGTRICFRLGDFDAGKLAGGFVDFDANALQSLGIGEAIARVERSEYDFNLSTSLPPVVADDVAEHRKRELIELSRKRYAHPIKIEKEAQPAVSQDRVFVYKPREVERPEKLKVPKRSVPPASVPVASVLVDEKSLSQHRYLQSLIKRMAEERGYRAVIEEPTPDGAGRVDVALHRNGEKIACEISVTTTEEHELQNIIKCLAAGFGIVVVCATDRKRLEKIQSLAVRSLDSAEQTKVLFFEPEALFFYLEEKVETEASGKVKETRVKGYRVKVQYQAISDAEKKKKREAVGHVIVQALRRLKGGN